MFINRNQVYEYFLPRKLDIRQIFMNIASSPLMSGTDIRGHEMCRHSFRSCDVRSGYPEWALRGHRRVSSRCQCLYNRYKTIVLRVLVPIVAGLDDVRGLQISIFRYERTDARKSVVPATCHPNTYLSSITASTTNEVSYVSTHIYSMVSINNNLIG
jgi:hypothetical protein